MEHVGNENKFRMAILFSFCISMEMNVQSQGPVQSQSLSRFHKGGAVAWWLTPRTPDPEVGGSSPTQVAVLCP